MVPPQIVVTTSSSSLKDKKLSWPNWLAYSGQFTHISGHPSAVGRTKDSERPTLYRCTTEPTSAVKFGTLTASATATNIVVSLQLTKIL